VGFIGYGYGWERERRPEVPGSAILVLMIRFLRGFLRESARFAKSLARLLRGGSVLLDTEVLARAAERLELAEARVTDGGLEGRSGDFQVVAEALQRTTVEGEVEDLLSVVVRTHLPFGFIPPGPPSATSALPVHIGDPELDALLQLRGDPVMASALLDHGTRRDLRLLSDVGLRAQAGALVLAVSYPVDGEELTEVVNAVLDLARRLRQPEDPVPLLTRNALEDPVSGVRSRCLELLARLYPGRDESREALRRGLEDSDHEVRRAAARLRERYVATGESRPGGP